MNSQIKITFQNQVQNFTEQGDIQLIQDYIEKKFSLQPESYYLGYNDDDGDFITISTQDDFNTFQELCQNDLRLEVIQNENNCQNEKISQQKDSEQKEQIKKEIDNSGAKKKNMIQKIKEVRKQVLSKFQQKNINSKTFTEEQKAEMRKKRMEAMKKKQAHILQINEQKRIQNQQDKQEFYKKAREDPHLSRVMMKLQSDIKKALPKLHDFLDEDFTYQKQQEHQQNKDEKQQFAEQQQYDFSLFSYLNIDSIITRGVQIENILKTQKKPINEKKYACKIQRFFMNIIRKKQQKKQDRRQNQENQQKTQLIKKQQQKCNKPEEKKEEKKEELTKKPQQNLEQQQQSFEKGQFSQELKQQDKVQVEDKDQKQQQSFFEVSSNLENNSLNLKNQEQSQLKQQEQEQQQQDQEEQLEQDEKFEVINQENKVNKQEKDENSYSIETAQQMQNLLGGVQIQYEQFLKNQQSGKTIEQLIDLYLSSLEF